MASRPLFLASFVLSAASAAPAAFTCSSAVTFDIRDYGARGDGVVMNTAAFASAVAQAAQAGTPSAAACVLVTDGDYVTGNVALASNVYLNVTPTGRVLGSANVTDYPRSTWATISSTGASNIGIVGGGYIDGQYQKYIGGWDASDNEFIPQGWPNCTGECRPRLVQLVNSSNIVVQGVHFSNASDWTFHLLGCDDVYVEALTQYGDERWPNNDGIDIDSSRNVTLLNSEFNTADDAVCIKSTAGYGVVANVLVRNVTARSRSAAVKFGSGTQTDMYNLVFENMTIWDSNRGLGIQQRDGGNIYNVTFRDISVETRRQPRNWWGSGETIYVSSMIRSPGTTVGVISNITFVNIRGRAESLSLLSGRAPGNTLHGITLVNVSIFIDKWSNVTMPPYHDYRPTSAIPDTQVSQINGLYVEAADGVVLNNLSVAYNTSNPQPTWSSVCVNVTDAGAPVQQTGCTCTPP